MSATAFQKIKDGLLEALGIARNEKAPERVWFVDREGVTYLPERKIVLRGKVDA